MSDVTWVREKSDDELVSLVERTEYIKHQNSMARAFDPKSEQLLLEVEIGIAQRELRRRLHLAAAARPEQVTLAMVNRVVQAILAQDIPDEGYVVNPLWTRLSTRMTSALAQLP